MRHLRHLGLALIFAGLLSGGGTAHAAVVLDQDTWGTPFGGQPFSGGTPPAPWGLAQTFTKGMVGDMVAFDVQLNYQELFALSTEIAWEIRAVDGSGAPLATSLASGTFTLSTTGIQVPYVTLPTPLSAVIGTMYAVTLEQVAGGGGVASWIYGLGPAPGPYAQGQTWVDDDLGTPGGFVGVPTVDFHLRTYVEAPVPEPCSLALLALGSLGLATRARRIAP